MSRAAAVERFGREEGDRFYKRFHTMRTKAAHSGVPFYWKSFDQFWQDFLQIMPPDFHPKTHRFKFDLSQDKGYCPETMSIVMTYFGASSKAPKRVTVELLNRLISDPEMIPDYMRERLLESLLRLTQRVPNESRGGHLDEKTIDWAVETALRIADKLEGEIEFNSPNL